MQRGFVNRNGKRKGGAEGGDIICLITASVRMIHQTPNAPKNGPGRSTDELPVMSGNQMKQNARQQPLFGQSGERCSGTRTKMGTFIREPAFTSFPFRLKKLGSLGRFLR